MSLLYGTKYTDMESGLIYYGHRYYDPGKGASSTATPSERKAASTSTGSWEIARRIGWIS